MKKIISVTFFLILCKILTAQSSIAEYNLKRTYQYTDDNGIKKVVGVVSLIAYNYIKDSVAISYEIPNYLKEFPDGRIEYQHNANVISFFSLSTDSLQQINKINFDSSEFYKPKENEILKWKFETGYQVWDYTNDTKIINGMSCQKAVQKLNDGSIYQIVWFAQEIPVKANLMNIQNLPGLAVEIEAPTINAIYQLTSFVQNVDIPDSVFNLKEFEGKKTRFVSHLRKPK